MQGAPPMGIFQSIAAGLLGRTASYRGGLPTAVLGGFLHFFIATTIVFTYYVASSKIAALRRRPVLYGIAVYFFMNYVVLPLSAIGMAPPFQVPEFLDGVIGHALLVGLPAALVSRE
jgi:uncharacterized membrane protein YagU involved in acid resistance